MRSARISTKARFPKLSASTTSKTSSSRYDAPLRDVSGDELAIALRKLGYEVTRQSGGHLRLTTSSKGEHHVTVPRHRSLRVGTLNGVLTDVAIHAGVTRDVLLELLFA